MHNHMSQTVRQDWVKLIAAKQILTDDVSKERLF